MNIENAKKEFSKYVEQYDLQNPKIKIKFEHCCRVMEASKKIAESLNLDDEEIEVATLIGLLHDIGRFEQIRLYDTFSDAKSIDHGDLGVEILQKDNYIRKYIEKTDYDNIILKSIKNHNKFEIQPGLSEKELLFAKIARDADKLDIFYEGVQFFWNTPEEVQKVQDSQITPEVFQDFKNHILIDRRKMKTEADDVLCFIGFAYDLNFPYSYMIVKKEDYLNKILDKFDINDDSFSNNNCKFNREQIQEIRKVLDKYIK